MTIRTRKIILWSLTLLIAAVLLFFWIKSIPKKMESFRTEEFIRNLNFPNFNGQETPTTTE